VGKIVVGHSTVVATEVAQIKSRLLLRLAILLTAAVGLTAVAAVRLIGPIRDRPRVTTSPAVEPQQPRPSSGTSPTVPLVQAESVYEGPLGDFIVGPHQGSDAPPCPRPLRPAKNEKIIASELYSPIFGENLEGFVTECADGKIVVIEIYGKEIIGRGYFVGKLIAPYEAPRHQLQLLTVGEKPAIAQLPPPGLIGGLRLLVIERFPSSNQPGVWVEVDDTSKSLDAAAELAARIMGVRP